MYLSLMFYLLLEPFHGFLLRDSVLIADSALSSLPVRHTVARPGQHHIEIHAIDPNTWVILDSQVNMLLNSEAKVTLIREVLLSELVLFNL